MRLLLAIAVLALAACAGRVPSPDNSEAFRAYAEDLNTTAIECIAQAGGDPDDEELPVPTYIGSYTWNPYGVPFVVNGQVVEAAIEVAELCFWEGTKHHHGVVSE